MKLIALSTKDSLDYADLYRQASSLWKQLEIPSRTGYFVPKIASMPAKSIVQRWKDAVSVISTEYNFPAFQAAIGEQIDQASEAVATQVYTSARKIMETVVDINETAADFNSANFENELKDKSAAVERAQTRIDEIQKDVTEKMNEFKANLNRYEKEQKEKAQEEQIYLYLEIAVDVGLAFYTGPENLIKGGGKLSKAAQKTKNIESAIKKTQRLKNIGELCGKFEKVHQVRDVAQTFAHAYFHPKNQAASSPDDIKARLDYCMQEVKSADGFDWGEMKMMWDDFEIDNEATFKDMELIPIQNKEDYHNALKKLVCRGRDWMVAQKEAQEVRRKATQAIAYQQLLESKKKEYVLHPQKRFTTALPLALVKAVLQSELDSARRSLFLAIHEWVLAFAYENGRVTLPKAKIPRIDGTAAEFVSGVAKLETEMEKSVLKDWQPSPAPLMFSTSDRVSVFEPQWKMMLKSEGQVQFLIPFDLPRGQPYSYVKSAT